MNETVAPKREPHFRLYTVEQLLDLPDPVWTVEGLLLERSLVMLYGPPKSLKTFLALDLALSIATGRPFHGSCVARGRVTYVAAEGHAAETRDRILAWCRANEVEPSELTDWFDLAITGVHLDQAESVREALKVIRSPRAVVFFDTLNRNMAGHENDTKEMTQLVAGCDFVRRTLRTAVVVVHHTGVDKTRSRGSTVLIGAVDTSLRVTRSGDTITLLVEAQRAGPDGSQWHFRLRDISLSDEETWRTSLVLEQTEGSTESSGPKPPSTDEQMLLRIRAEKPKKFADLISDEVKGFSNSNVYKARKRLIDEGLLQRRDRPTLTLAGVALAEKLEAVLQGTATKELEVELQFLRE